MDFTKSNRGLGEEYADDYAKKLFAANKDMFLDNDLSGADAGLKKEIDSLFNGLMRNLNQLSNVHFTPKRLTKEAEIRTQNVPALTLEEAIPIGVSGSSTKTAKEVFTIDPKAMRTKEELTKEEKRKERAHRKRQIRSHL
jgi:U3 small nucleolar RNA-associated protein MPP10